MIHPFVEAIAQIEEFEGSIHGRIGDADMIEQLDKIREEFAVIEAALRSAG